MFTANGQCQLLWGLAATLGTDQKQLANAIDISTDKVIAVSLPKSVVNSLNGRDYR